jgi:ATP-dependent RNA helicase DeaD
MDQKMRSKVLERFKNRTLQAIVATDVAARGIDVNDITHVINYELPDDPEVYTHRSGRTARAGKSGICISIVSPKEVGSIRTIERIVKNKFNKCDIPDGAEIVRKRLFHFLEQIENVQPESEFADVYLNMIHEKFETMEKDELIKRLIFLQLQETIQTYQKSHDLNALSGGDAKNAGVAVRGAVWTRMFLNIGQKDGFNEASLTQFICDQTDLKPDVLDRVTVRDLSSFYNVKTDVVDLIIESISSKKFKGRKLRTEEADKKDASRGPSRGGYGGGRPGGDRNGGGRSYGGGDRGGRGYGGDRGNSERSGGGRSYGGDRSGSGERGGYFKSRDEKAGRSSSAGRGDSYRGGGRNRD